MNLNLRHLLQKPILKRGIFDKISGYPNVKWILESATRTYDCHILLVGSPGLGKTRFLKSIESKYQEETYFALGSGSSGAGMVDQLFQKHYRYLLVDEIEDMKVSDQAVLLSLMQDGDLIETKKVNTRRIENYKVTVIATCNSTKKIRPALLSRFKVIHLDPYTQEQFMNVCVEQLDVEPTFASYIASAVWNRTKEPNMREAERISKMCRTEDEVDRYLELEKYG